MNASNADVEAIRRFFDALLAVWKTMDVERYLRSYTEGALWMLPDRWPDADKTAMRTFYRDVFEWAAPDPQNFHITLDEILVLGDCAMVRWTPRGRWLPKDGTSPVPGGGRHISILRRLPDGSWRIERDIFNNPPAEG